jgi:hypothetical protein
MGESTTATMPTWARALEEVLMEERRDCDSGSRRPVVDSLSCGSVDEGGKVQSQV